MREYKVKVSEAAEIDMEDIEEYITDVLGNPIAADNHMRAFYHVTQSLKISPHSALVRDETLAKRGLRWVAAKNYMMFYIVDEEKKKVDVLRVLHGRRNWANILMNIDDSV